MIQSLWTSAEVHAVLRSVLADALSLPVKLSEKPGDGALVRHTGLPFTAGLMKYALRMQTDSAVAVAMTKALCGPALPCVGDVLEQDAVNEVLNLIGGRLAGTTRGPRNTISLGTPVAGQLNLTGTFLWAVNCEISGGQMRLELWAT
jgi:hypothetical protein